MYTIVNGNNAGNFMNFVGITGLFNQMLVNPYTGYSITINDTLNINNAVYDGMGGNDTLNMTAAGDVLQLLDSSGTVMIRNVEVFNASEGGDIINLAFLSALYGNVIIRGAGGNDILWGNNGHDNILGGGGDDNLIGGGGNDHLYGGDGNDYISGAAGADLLAGGAGNDLLVYSTDNVWGSSLTLSDLGSSVFFSDSIDIGGKNRTHDSFHGDTNDDGSISVQGSDALSLSGGHDVLLLIDSYSPQQGPIGARVSYVDIINAGEGNDVIDLSGAVYTNDLAIDGGIGNDVLIGSSADDTIHGGQGHDSLYGGLGDDTYDGGAGDDVYYYAAGDGNKTIIETSGQDSIHFDDGIALADIAFTVQDKNLSLQIGAATVTIENHYAEGYSGRIENLVFADGSTFDLASYVPNEAPQANDDNYSSFRDTPLTGNVLSNDTDSDNNVLSVEPQTITTVNGGIVEILADGTFNYTPAQGYVGQDSFGYSVIDGKGGQDTGSVSLTITYKPDDIVGSNSNDIALIGRAGDDSIFGLSGDDILYGDDGYLGGVIRDKVFSDSVSMPDLKERVNIESLKPSGISALGIANSNLSVDFDATATITFRKGYAGNNNSFGSFGIAEDGTISGSTVHWANVKTAGIDTAHTIDLPVGTQGGDFGFFIISDGFDTNSGYKNLDITGEGNIHFVYNHGKTDARAAKITDDGANISILYNDGITSKILKGNVYFTTEREEDGSLNKDGKTHVVSGLLDLNNLVLNPVKADHAARPNSFTKNGITVEAVAGVLTPGGDRIGIQHSNKKDTIGGAEEIRISFAASDKVIVSLSDVAGKGTGIDFKIYLEGASDPVFYEYAVGDAAPKNGKVDILLDGSIFGGLITKIEISSIDNSLHGLETFYLDNIKAFVAGGYDMDTIRIGFEDLHNLGDADYEDVLFDLNINPVNLGDIEGGDDILDGGVGNDTLYGEGGDDILVIGLGLDKAYGGAGEDIFAITTIDEFADRIEDFNGDQGDAINIADVLEGYDPLTADIGNYIRLIHNGADTEVQINRDGDAGGEFTLAALIVGNTDIDLSSIIADQNALA